jgi:hypothetical protein
MLEAYCVIMMMIWRLWKSQTAIITKRRKSLKIGWDRGGDGANEIDIIVEDYAKRLGLDEALPIPVRERGKRDDEEEEPAPKRPDI